MVTPAYPVIDVTHWRVAAEEPSGADAKVWLADPAEGELWLFKPVTIKGEHVHGENWAEKVASELGNLLAVPCARVEMAVRDGEVGAISRNLRPAGFEMHNGAVLLSDLVDDYIPGAYAPAGRPGHNLENIKRVLDGASTPPGAALPGSFSAFDTFAGILVLDAWIANRDRHDENWSVLVPRTPGTPRRLCGSYDQAGCLGFNLRDASRSEILTSNRLPAWVRKGTAWRFEHQGKPPSLVALAHHGLGLASSEARQFWLAQLEGVTEDTEADL
ncbi:hypothetical protein O2W15_04460, partial [Modestobacter sp. VKM Ac-2979]|nr:hypothetical protein [Modestobacter sp. VKM Ac-2979]